MERQFGRLFFPASVRLQINAQAVGHAAHVIEQRGHMNDVDDIGIGPAHASEFIDPVLGDARGVVVRNSANSSMATCLG